MVACLEPAQKRRPLLGVAVVALGAFGFGGGAALGPAKNLGVAIDRQPQQRRRPAGINCRMHHMQVADVTASLDHHFVQAGGLRRHQKDLLSRRQALTYVND